MTSVEEHYKNLLAEHYSWMLGNLEERIADQKKVFVEHNINPGSSQLALDLACGSGIQSIALAQLGFHVTAVDTNQTLLEELNDHSSSARIFTVQTDMLDPSLYQEERKFQSVSCMGDSLVHLQSEEEVHQLFQKVFQVLVPGGKLILSYRDLSQELTGTDRNIPVKLEEEKLMTTFLEYSPTHVTVNDTVFTKENGAWNMNKSSYQKLRISTEKIVELLEISGFNKRLKQSQIGFQFLIATK